MSVSSKKTSGNYYEAITSYKCPKCKNIFAITSSVAKHHKIRGVFSHSIIPIEDGYSLEIGGKVQLGPNPNLVTQKSGVDVIIMQCPRNQCSENIVYINSFGPDFENYKGQLIPSQGITFIPEYVPKNIKEDINEAESIVKLSPKASATLSRRALQSMIRDFHNIHKKTLHQEISELNSLGLVNPTEFQVLNDLKSIGNNGAHENLDGLNLIIDIEDHEAEDLIQVLHHFIDKWYSQRERDNSLFKRVGLAAKK